MVPEAEGGWVDGREMPPNNRMNPTLLISALINGSLRALWLVV